MGGVGLLIGLILATMSQEQEQFKQSTGIRPHMEIIERLVAAPLAPVAAASAAASATTARSRKSTGAASSSDSLEEYGTGKKRSRRKKESESEATATTSQLRGGSVGSTASGGSGTVTPTQGIPLPTTKVKSFSHVRYSVRKDIHLSHPPQKNRTFPPTL